MDKYTKKELDELYIQALFGKPKAVLSRLSKKDISDYQLGLKKFDSNDNTEKCVQIKIENPNCSLKTVEECSEPSRKKLKSNCLPGIIKEENSESHHEQVQSNKKETSKSKLVLSREGKADKCKAQRKSAIINNISGESSVPSSDISDAVQTKVDCIAIKNESTALDNKTESIKPWEINGKISVRNVRNMIDKKFLRKYDGFISGITMKISAQTKRRTATGSNATASSSTPPVRRNLSLSDVEKLYRKYFNKKVQDSIYIISNILNIISLSNRHHKTRMDESFKKKTEAEKLKERCDANRIHNKHQKILESKLKMHFESVVSSFVDTEFELSFQMFFLSIISVIRILDKPKFPNGNIFKNLVFLLWNSLKNCNFNNHKIISMFRSESFRPKCSELITMIEDNRDIDPDIINRMWLFFIPSINCNVFEPVVDAVTSDSDDLKLLLENAIINSYLQATFKDPKEYTGPVLKRTASFKTPVLPVQTSVSSINPVQHRVITKGPRGTSKLVSVSNSSSLHPTSSSSAGNIISTQPLNALYQNVSRTMLPRVSETRVTTAPKLSTIAPATITSGSLVTPTVIQLKPIRSIQPIKTASIQKTGIGQVFLMANKNYQLIKVENQPRNMNTINATVNSTVHGTNNSSTSRTNSGPKTAPLVLCYRKDCSKPATIMCCECTSVKYCAKICQTQDWFDSHIKNCKALKNERDKKNQAMNSNNRNQ